MGTLNGRRKKYAEQKLGRVPVHSNGHKKWLANARKQLDEPAEGLFVNIGGHGRIVYMTKAEWTAEQGTPAERRAKMKEAFTAQMQRLMAAAKRRGGR